jgi:hypothetical protein
MSHRSETAHKTRAGDDLRAEVADLPPVPARPRAHRDYRLVVVRTSGRGWRIFIYEPGRSLTFREMRTRG